MSCGTRARDFRPGDPDGASTPSSIPRLRTAGDAHYWVACDSATLRQPAPIARPASGLAWNPTAELPGARVRSRRLHRGTAHLLHCGYCELHLRVPPPRGPRYCSRRPPITAGLPVRPSVPSPSCDHPGFGTPPAHRTAHCDYLYCCTATGSSSLPGPSVSLGYERNHNHTSTQCLLRTT